MFDHGTPTWTTETVTTYRRRRQESPKQKIARLKAQWAWANRRAKRLHKATINRTALALARQGWTRD